MAETKDGVYVMELNTGEKYVWAKLSLPRAMLDGESVDGPADLRQLVNRWHAAWLRERKPKGAVCHS